MPMQSYLKKWQLKNPEKLTTTHTSDVYKVYNNSNESLILKCLNEVGREDEAGGAALLKWYGGDGAVNLIASDDEAHLLEYADGEELASLVKTGSDIEATSIICEVIKKLHTRREAAAPQTLVPLKEWLQDLFDAAKISNDETIKLAAKVADELFSTTNEVIPLHGDLHHHNIMGSKRGWLAIDPKGLLGDPCYDLANFYGNPEGMQKVWLDIERVNMLTNTFSRELGYCSERLIKFAFVHNIISSIWDGCSAVDKKARVEVAKLVYSLLSDI